jgi:4a-hydroxytetrahydrobiopterin dehydratase
MDCSMRYASATSGEIFMSDQWLSNKKCKPCEGGVPPLDETATAELMQALHPDWQQSDDGKWISRRFAFDQFTATMGFVNAVAWVAESEDHHPDLQVAYGYCVVKWSTHDIDGLSENDFICAAKVDRLID